MKSTELGCAVCWIPSTAYVTRLYRSDNSHTVVEAKKFQLKWNFLRHVYTKIVLFVIMASLWYHCSLPSKEPIINDFAVFV